MISVRRNVIVIVIVVAVVRFTREKRLEEFLREEGSRFGGSIGREIIVG